METTTTSKGQIVIPAKLRKRFGITPGTRIHVDIDEEGKRIVLTPITAESIRNLVGKYRGANFLETLMEERRRDRDS